MVKKLNDCLHTCTSCTKVLHIQSYRLIEELGKKRSLLKGARIRVRFAQKTVQVGLGEPVTVGFR